MKRILAFMLVFIFIAGCFSCAQNIGSDGETPVLSSAAPTDGLALTDAPAEASAVPSAAPDIRPALSTNMPSSFISTATPAPVYPAALPTPNALPSGTAHPTQQPIPAPTYTPNPTEAAVPTAVPSAVPSSVPTAVPSPTPPPATDGSITFSPSASLPLPSMAENVPHGQPFCFGGVVRCAKPILSVTAVITSSGGVSVTSAVNFDAADNKTAVELVDTTFPSSGNQSLTAKVKFENLAVGSYTFNLYASAVGCPSRLIASSSFKVVKSEWIQLISNNLRNNYAYALSFFGSRDEFLFRYKWDNGRQITVESGWLNSHFTSVTSPAGKTWYVHKKAAPSFNQAIGYLQSTYIRVGGTYESGVVRLWDLVASFDGILNTRFVTDRTFVSHHAFGTAIDLNASMDVNRSILSNRNLIKNEVKNCLAYNGIKEQNGIKYYDFTYTGSCPTKHKNVPTTIINYLIYELAFYRAGFGWGYYYNHTCDAMHFSVSEMPADIHNSSGRSLRKVYSYIG